MKGWTPGPWVVELLPFGNGHRRIIINDKRVAVATVSGDGSRRQADANADLIAAAPDLLEALEAAVDVHGTGYSWGKNAVSALAKARGDQ